MAAWLKARKMRVTVDDALCRSAYRHAQKHGIFFGVW